MGWIVETTPCDRPVFEAAIQTHSLGSVWKCACGKKHVLLSNCWGDRTDIDLIFDQVRRGWAQVGKSGLAAASSTPNAADFEPYIERDFSCCEDKSMPLFLDVDDQGRLKAIANGTHYFLSGPGQTDFENALGHLWAQVRRVAKKTGAELEGVDAEDDGSMPYFAVHDHQVWLYLDGTRKALTDPGRVNTLSKLTRDLTPYTSDIAEALFNLYLEQAR
jgi:hypothetical protein